MPKINSVYFQSTGKVVAEQERDAVEASLKPHEIIRDNTIHEAVDMGDRRISRRQSSIFKNGRDLSEGFERQNAVGDVSDTATGYQIAIDTLTYIKKKVSNQKFYEVAPGDFIPVVVGEGAFSAQILTNLSYTVADDFESGNMRTGASDARLASVDVAVNGVNVPVVNWAKALGYTIFDVEQALRANNWDPIEQKHRSRKKNWDLGIQKIAFLGSATSANVPGLLTNTNINQNTSLITMPIGQMSATQLQTFVTSLIATYYTNTNSTAMPNRFVIPYTDYVSLTAFVPNTVGATTSTYPVSILEYLNKAFKEAVMPYEKDFKILPLSYADAANNSAGLHYYMLYRDDDESIRMDIPVPYTTTQPNSLDNFSFTDAGYGQYTGCNVYRNLEVLRFQY